VFSKSQQTPCRPISPMSKFNVDAFPISTPTQTHKAQSLSRATHSAAARRSCPLRPHPASLPAGTAPSPPHPLIPSPPPHPPALNHEFLRTLPTGGLPAGVEDDGPLSRAVRLASGWALPASYRPWDPLLVHGIDDRSWTSLVTGRLQGRRCERAPASSRGLPTTWTPWART
jgi:hypothetical protein